MPVIAAVHGPALGGGLQIALGADLRIVAPDAKLSVLEARWGLIPDMTGTVMLPKLVGLDVAKDLTFTGRMVSGDGGRGASGSPPELADDPRAAAMELAADLVTKSPDALREGKRLLNLSGTRPVAEQLHDERVTMGSLIGSPNQVEATTRLLREAPPSLRRRKRSHPSASCRAAPLTDPDPALLHQSVVSALARCRSARRGRGGWWPSGGCRATPVEAR